MAVKKINKANAFQIPADKFIIGPSSSGYTLNYSADGIHWTAWKESTGANQNQVVVGLPTNTYVKLVGNTADNIIIRY
jgi:hypothetical protein